MANSPRGKLPPLFESSAANDAFINSFGTRKTSFDGVYASKADEFYLKALQKYEPKDALANAAPADDDDEPTPPPSKGGNNQRLRFLMRKAMGKTSLWDHLIDSWMTIHKKRALKTRKVVGAEDPHLWVELKERFLAFSKDAIATADDPKGEEKSTSKAVIERRQANVAARRQARLRIQQASDERQVGTPLRAKFGAVWNERTSPAWQQRTSPAWGGLGYNYDLVKGEEANLNNGWDEGVAGAAKAFDERHTRFASDMKRLVAPGQGAMAYALDEAQFTFERCVFGLRSNRFAVQPLRMPISALSPRGNTMLEAHEAYKQPLALANSRGGGPLVPVYARKLASDAKLEDDEEEVKEEPPPVPWTLYRSVWGPRCEWCDGNDFHDHEEIVFERFASDWQRVLRFGIHKAVTDMGGSQARDDDGDGVPDEIADIGAVLFVNNELYTLAWLVYSEVVVSSSSDVDGGVKGNGWRQFTDDIKVWEHLKESDKAVKDTSVFASSDKTDKETAAAISIQSTFRGHRARASKGKVDIHGEELVKESKAAIDMLANKEHEIQRKSDNALSRAEFCTALIKIAFERFVKSAQNKKNELEDVSDAVERLFLEHIEPHLGTPAPARSLPKLPLPDEFRSTVCYTQEMSEAIGRCAPSLRVLFGGLAKLTFEKSRKATPQWPRWAWPKPSRIVKRDKSEWVVVTGHLSYPVYTQLLTALDFPGITSREVSLCFLYSVMCVIDGQSEDGRIKERHLPFEGFLECLIRLATVVPLPTDEMLEGSDARSVATGVVMPSHAGAYMAQVEANDEEGLKDMIYWQECEWGGVPDVEAGGEMPRRLEHLVDVIMRKIKQPKEGKEDEPLTTLTRREFRTWAIKALGASESEVPDGWAKEKGVGESDYVGTSTVLE